ncbi:MAG TPA: hypothetical protein VFB70_13925 [Pyrinomonadaceae bacterium]|nr:hypothetical protein [Pyrinomonadaceae bacterium]
MQATIQQEHIDRYARTVAASKRVRWSIEEDVIRQRTFDTTQKFLPDGLSKVKEFAFLSEDEQRYLSQIQGRTYANIFGLVERYIDAKVLELTRGYWFGDQTALEALVRFSDEELKHQELFRRIERLVAERMPPGYQFKPDADQVAKVVLAKSTWAVLALTLHIELFTQMHYRQSIEPDENLSPLFKDVFLFHWKEESQHAILDELEWVRCDQKITAEARDKAVDEFIELVVAVDGILQGQAADDSRYFVETCGRRLSPEERDNLETGLLRAYRWQYILSGAQHPHFIKVLTSLTTEAQTERIQSALTLLM